MKRKTRTIKMAEETRKFKSKLKNGSKNFILDTIKVSSGHRIRHGGTYDPDLRDNRTTEFVELQARNTNKGQDATLYIPAKNLDRLIKALQEVRPPLPQLCFGELVADIEDDKDRFLAQKLTDGEIENICRKECVV